MTPRAKRDLPPFIHEIQWRPFQRLSNELFSHEPDIEKSDEFGIPGQRQDGIDLIAIVKGSGLEVAQCKCESSFSVGKIRNASKEFFRHWAYWRSKGVRRFILFVACEVERTELQREMLKQRARFAKRGISYEMWGATTIRNKLRPYRTIARAYFDSEEIVSAICGPVDESPATTAAINIVMNRLGIFATELEELRSEELEDLRELSRSGEQSKALDGIRKLKESPNWLEHSVGFRARLLRFEAAVQLNLRLDVDSAAKLMNEARQLDPNTDFQTTDAYLAYCRHDTDAALDYVETPKSAEARNLRWNLLLESGKLDVLAEEAARIDFPPDAETYRVLTLLALACADIPRAQFEITKAIELGENRRSIRLAKAKVDYFSALSPAFEGIRTLSWPVPVSWIFVKRDTASVNALRAAESEFLAGASHSDCPPTERENLMVWRLACASCVDSRQAEASAVAQQILGNNPANYGAVAWALHRGYVFDQALAEKELRKRLKQEPNDINVWLILWNLVWRDGDVTNGEAIVDEAEPAFRRTGNTDLWLFHKIQFVARKDQDQAKKLANDVIERELKRSVQFASLRAAAKTAKGRKELAESLAADFAATGNFRRLFECCELKLRLGDFNFIAQHSKQLLVGIGTASALRLALEAVFKHGDYALCLALLNDGRHLFREGTLSPDLRSLKAICQHQLGEWSEATKEAGQMYLDQPIIETFSAYFDLLLRSGDTRRCSVLARDLLTLKGAKPVHWLRATSVARLHDFDLAKELWRLANRKPIKDLRLAGFSLELAFALGVPDEAEQLFARLRRLARKGRGPLREKSIDETLKLFQARRENAEKITQLYEEGAAPIHLLAEQMNWPLVLVYHAQLEANRAQTNLLHRPILFARSGARAIEAVSTKSMLVDISALILGADLAILDKVEETFKPLYISPHTTESLVEQVTQLYPSQPERQEARQKILELVRAGHVAVIPVLTEETLVAEDIRQQLGAEHASLLEYAVKVKGVVLHDGPFLAEGLTSKFVELPATVANHVVPLRMLEHRPTGPALEEALGLTDGTTVLLPHHVVGSLRVATIESAVKRFRLMVSAGAVAQLEAEAAAFEHSRRLANWTQTLLDRLQRGLDTDTYRVFRTVPPTQRKPYDESKPTTKALYDTLIATGLPEGLTWCDDRMTNRHIRAGTRIVVGISEVLQLLKARRAISTDEYFGALLQLRESNVRYLPLAAGEIEYHLSKTQIVNGRLIETPALSVIRRYVNACMLDRGKLQPPLIDSKGNMQVREYEFPVGLRRSIDAALLATWKNPKIDLIDRTAQADWLLDQLYFDLLGVRQAFAQPTGAGDVRDLIAGSLGMLFGEGIGVEFRADDETDVPPRQAFFEWLNTRLLEPLSKVEPALIGLSAKVVSNFIVSNISDETLDTEPEHRAVERFIWARFINDLPKTIQGELDLPVAVQAQLGVTMHGSSVSIAGRMYDYAEYRRAVAAAVNGRTGYASGWDEAHKLTMQLVEWNEHDRVTISVEGGDAAHRFTLSEAALPILSDSIEARTKFMKSRLYWFDCPAEKRESEIQRIAKLESAADRFDALDDWRNGSAECVYGRLAAMRNERGSFKISDLTLPSWDRLLNHLRISQASSVDVALSQGCEMLLAEEGLFTALARLMCLPIKLPAILETSWLEMTDVKAEELFSRLYSEPHSLVADIHFLRLATVRVFPNFQTVPKEIGARLMNAETGEARWKCFKSLLTLVDGEFNRWSPGRNLQSWIKLACIWYHTSRLSALLPDSDDDIPRLVEWLETHINPWTEETLARDQSFWTDIARPTNVARSDLIVHGIAVLLGDLPSTGESELSDKLKALLEQETSEATNLQIELARRTDFRPNNLKSFLGQATAPQIMVAFNVDLKNLFASVSDSEISRHLEDLAKRPEDPALWALLSTVVGDSKLPQPLSTRLMEILRTVSFDGLAQSRSPMFAAALTFACQHAQRTRDVTLIQRMEETVIAYAPMAAQRAASDEGQVPLWLGLSNALLSLAVIAGDEEQSARRFFDLFRRFVELCPPAASRLSDASANWAKRLPLSQQVNLWPLIFAVRALR